MSTWTISIGEIMNEKVIQTASHSYAQPDAVSDDFINSRRRHLKQTVEDRQLMIRLLKEVHTENMQDIEAEREEKLARLQFLPVQYGQERTGLLGSISRLRSEERSQRVRLVSDVARFSKELLENLEEYSEMKGLTDTPVRRRGGMDAP